MQICGVSVLGGSDGRFLRDNFLNTTHKYPTHQISPRQIRYALLVLPELIIKYNKAQIY